MTNPEALIRNVMQGLMSQDYPPSTATGLAEECAWYWGFDEWLNDPEHEVWEVATEFFDSDDYPNCLYRDTADFLIDMELGRGSMNR